MGAGATEPLSERLNRLRAAGQSPLLAENAPCARRAFCEAVYAVLQETLWASACSISFQILRTSQEQEDAIHAALVRIFEITLQRCLKGGIRWTEPDDVLSAYFKKIARRALAKERDKIGSRLRRMRRMNTLDQDLEDPDGGDTADLTDLKHAVETLVEDEIDRLLILFRSEGAPYVEISRRLKEEKGREISVAALRKRLTRAIHDLRAKLAKQDAGGGNTI